MTYKPQQQAVHGLLGERAHCCYLRQCREGSDQVAELDEQLQAPLQVAVPAGAAQVLLCHAPHPVTCTYNASVHNPNPPCTQLWTCLPACAAILRPLLEIDCYWYIGTVQHVLTALLWLLRKSACYEVHGQSHQQLPKIYL